VLDGSSALRKAVVDVFYHPIIARCQLHKIRNVQDKLPQHLRGPGGTKMRAAYHADSALLAEAKLQALARELDKTPRGSPPACAKAWPRPSPCCGWGCHPRWRAR